MPTSYMTALLVGPMLGLVLSFWPLLKSPSAMMLPSPRGSSRHHFSDEIPNTFPSGATHWRGYHHRL